MAKIIFSSYIWLSKNIKKRKKNVKANGFLTFHFIKFKRKQKII